MTTLEKVDFVKVIFVGGVKAQLEQEWTWGLAAGTGLQQGLKYKGDIKAGLIGGVATLIAVSGACGAYNIVINRKKIKEAFKKED